MDVSQLLLVVGAVVVIVAAVVARIFLRQKLYQRMNQPGKQKSALQKFFGW